MNEMEREFKWAVFSASDFARFRTALRNTLPAQHKLVCKPVHNRDYYLEDSAGSLSARKIALRLRNADGRWEATLKTKTELVDGQAVRKELTRALPGVHTLDEALAKLRALKSFQGVKVRDVNVRFEINNRRRTYLLHPSEKEMYEVAFDNFYILVPGRKLYMKEIELEFKKGTPTAFEAFAKTVGETAGLRRAKTSKVKTAAAMLAWEKNG